MARTRRKSRPGEGAGAVADRDPRPDGADAGESPPPGADAPDETDALRRGYARGRERDEAIRATLTPLGPDERPPALKAAVAAAIGLALANLAAFAAGYDVSGRGSGAGGLLFVAVMALAAWGMWQRHYWAVLGFVTLLALIIVTFTLLLLIASNVLAVVVCLAVTISAGLLFWKLIRVLGRLQAPRRVP